MCPFCKNNTQIIKRGIYIRPSDKKKIQRYCCKICEKSYSSQTTSFDYRLRKRRINQQIFHHLAKGTSQRGCARLLSVHPTTIARRVHRFRAFNGAHKKLAPVK